LPNLILKTNKPVVALRKDTDCKETNGQGHVKNKDIDKPGNYHTLAEGRQIKISPV